MRPLYVICYYTPDADYRARAKNLQRSARQYGLTAIVVERPSRAKASMPPMMGWVLNCAYCAEVVQWAMDQFPGDRILYLDADAEIVNHPDLFFDESAIADIDFAFPVLTNKWVQNELVSNTLYFSGGERSKTLVDQWAAEQSVRLDRMMAGDYPGPYRIAWDQRVLQDVLSNRPDVKCLELPWGYAKIAATDAGVEIMDGVREEDIVIRQYQASRKNKNVVGKPGK